MVNVKKRLREEMSAEKTLVNKSKQKGEGINSEKEDPKHAKEQWTVGKGRNKKSKSIKLVNNPDAIISGHFDLQLYC